MFITGFLAVMGEGIHADETCFDQYAEHFGTDDSSSTPLRVHNALYLRCVQAATQLRIAMTSFGGYYLFDESAIEAALDGEVRDAHERIRQYARSCLVNTNELDRPKHSELFADVKSQLVVFVRNGERVPYCNGIIINENILTARHCIVGSSLVNGVAAVNSAELGEFRCQARIGVLAKDIGVYSIQDFGTQDPPQPIHFDYDSAIHPSFYSAAKDAICGVSSGNSFEEQAAILSSDWITLPIAKESTYTSVNPLLYSETPILEGSAVTTALVGYTPHLLLDEILRSSNSDNLDLYNAIHNSVMVDYSHQCSEISSSSAAFFHGCQTERSTSGAPFIRYQLHFSGVDDDPISKITWSVVGINTGTNYAKSLCEDEYTEPTYLWSIQNGGIWITPDVMGQ